MKSRVVPLMVSLCVLMYLCLSLYSQQVWEASCQYATVQATPVYIPGTRGDIAATLPAGTPCRPAETVGDSWQTIEYRVNGVSYVGMVRMGSLVTQTEP